MKRVLFAALAAMILLSACKKVGEVIINRTDAPVTITVTQSHGDTYSLTLPPGGSFALVPLSADIECGSQSIRASNQNGKERRNTGC